MESKPPATNPSTVIRAALHRILDEVAKKIIEQWLIEVQTQQKRMKDPLSTSGSQQAALK